MFVQFTKLLKEVITPVLCQLLSHSNYSELTLICRIIVCLYLWQQKQGDHQVRRLHLIRLFQGPLCKSSSKSSLKIELYPVQF